MTVYCIENFFSQMENMQDYSEIVKNIWLVNLEKHNPK